MHYTESSYVIFHSEYLVLEIIVRICHNFQQIEVSEELYAWFVEKGYDPKMGARPLGRLVDEHLRKSLAKELLFGDLEKGGRVLAKFDGTSVKFEIKKKKMEKIS